MSSQIDGTAPAIHLDPVQAAQTLGKLLSQTPEYKAFIEALGAVNRDLTIQKLARDMRSHQIAVQWGGDADGQHAADLARLELEMEDQPLQKDYRKAVQEVSVLFHAVDKIISQQAGMEFAINALRSGCSCGG